MELIDALVYLTFHFPISIVVQTLLLLDKFHRRCMKEKLPSAMRDLEEMLEICLSSRQ